MLILINRWSGHVYCGALKSVILNPNLYRLVVKSDILLPHPMDE